MFGLEAQGVARRRSRPVGLPRRAAGDHRRGRRRRSSGPRRRSRSSATRTSRSRAARSRRGPARRSTPTGSSWRWARRTSPPGSPAGSRSPRIGSRTAIIDAMRAHSQVTGLVAAVSRRRRRPAGARADRAHPAGGARGHRHLRRAPAHRLEGPAPAAPASGSRSSGSPWPPSSACSCSASSPGILVAVGLSVAELFMRVARPPASVLGPRPRARRPPRHRRLSRGGDDPGAASCSATTPRCASRTPQDFRIAALRAVDEPGGAGRVVPAQRRGDRRARRHVRGRAPAADRGASQERHVVFAMARVKQDLRRISRRRGCST